MLGKFFSKSSITETKSLEDVEITIVNSINDIVTGSGDDTIIKATSLTAGGNIEVSVGVDADGNIINPTGQFKILTDKGKEYLSVQTYDSGFVKYTITDKGYESEAIVHALINSGGDFVINAPGGVLAEYKHTGDFMLKH